MDQPIEKIYYAIGVIVNHTCSWLNYGVFEVITPANRYPHVSHIPSTDIQSTSTDTESTSTDTRSTSTDANCASQDVTSELLANYALLPIPQLLENVPLN